MHAQKTCAPMLSGVCCAPMLELNLSLSYEAMQAIATGERIEMAIEEEDMVITIGASEEALQKFKDATQKAILVMAAAAPNTH